jgi:hypothetical protein
VIRVGDIAKPLFAVGIVTVVAATPLGAGAFQLTYVAVESGDATGQTVPVGERVQRSVSIPAQSSPLTHTVVRGEGMRVEEATRTGTTLNVSVSIPPPTVPGVERLTLNVFPYPAVLPPAVIERLHDIHPLAAVGTCVTVIFGPLYALYALLFDGRRPIVLPRSRFLRRLLGV